MTNKQMEAAIAALQAENAALKSRPAKALSFKVSTKGGMSVYGLNARFPVTLYREQWVRLLNCADEITQFLSDHDTEFTSKDSPAPAPATSVANERLARVARDIADQDELSPAEYRSIIETLKAEGSNVTDYDADNNPIT